MRGLCELALGRGPDLAAARAGDEDLIGGAHDRGVLGAKGRGDALEELRLAPEGVHGEPEPALSLADPLGDGHALGDGGEERAVDGVDRQAQVAQGLRRNGPGGFRELAGVVCGGHGERMRVG